MKTKELASREKIESIAYELGDQLIDRFRIEFDDTDELRRFYRKIENGLMEAFNEPDYDS